jgi:aldehyde dehydrogenase (NAD+)
MSMQYVQRTVPSFARVASPSRTPSRLVADLRDAFRSGRTRPVDWRLEQLAGLTRLIVEHEPAIGAALAADSGRPALEVYAAELGHVRSVLERIRDRLVAWTEPEPVETPLLGRPGSSRIHREPLGVVLILAAYNYPFRSAVAPLIGALSAGNCAVVEPSETNPALSHLLASLLPRYVDATCVKVVTSTETKQLLAERFDHIHFAGSAAGARSVSAAAAAHLTPLTLELGGKNPCIVDCEVDLDVAVRRICWGKFTNAGQTSVAPDYLLVHERVEQRVLERLAGTIRDFYGPDPRQSRDFGRIAGVRHFARVLELLRGGGEVVVGGQADASDRYIAPTVLRDVPPSAPVMADEILGPILPVLKVRNIEDAIEFVEARPKPPILYLFGTNQEVQRRVVENTSSGEVHINHVSTQFALPRFVLGGASGSARELFETFSNRKRVSRRPTRTDSMEARLLYPPYTERKSKWLKRLA